MRMNKQRLQLILIVAAFLLPAMLSIMLQTRWFHWEPGATRNRGELIRPVIALANNLANRQVLADGHRWTVLVRIPAACDVGCERRILLLSHIREAQGKEMDRVQMLAWASASAALQAPWVTWIPQADIDARLALPEGGVMLIDPLGNAMMRFQADADPTDVRKDLAHLLRWSKVGK